MSTTTVLNETLAKALNEAEPNTLADALREYGIGMALSPQKWTWVGAAGATAVPINTAAFLAAATAGAKTPALPQNQLVLPNAMHIASLRVTTGASGTLGNYAQTDAGGTPAYPGTNGSGGVVALSDDGSTLTFPAAVQGFVIQYVPRSVKDVTSTF